MTTIMPVKHTLVAGITAFALLVTPVGLTAQWSDHGPAISTTPAISKAYAASNRPTSTKPPANGGPATTTSGGGNVSKTRGFHPSLFVDQMNEYCQTMADGYDAWIDLAANSLDKGDGDRADQYYEKAGEQMEAAQSDGCVFVPA